MMVNEEAKRLLRLVFTHVVDSVKPNKLLHSQLKFDKNQLFIENESYRFSKNCYVVGFGKAVLEMASVISTLLGHHINKGIISIPLGSLNPQNSESLSNKVFKIFQGARDNIPDENSFKAAQEILGLANSLTSNDILIVLISGGGSALLTYPVPPVTLSEKIKVTKLLAKAGANINEMNTVRRQLSMVKGGKLAEAAYPCQVISLILSDVINDPLDTISSGPTVPNKDQTGSGLRIVEKFNLSNEVPQNVIYTLRNFKNEQQIDVFKNSKVFVIGNNKKALAAGKDLIGSMDKTGQVLTSELQGNVIDIADELCKFAKYICKFYQNKITREELKKGIIPLTSLSLREGALEDLMSSLTSSKEIFLLFGGETTVHVKGNGKGGRNMELTLRFSGNINDERNKDDLEGFNILLLSAGTDGIDGPTDSAGAIAYLGQIPEAYSQGLDINDYLSENDSYNFFKRLNDGKDLITVGHTGTNVMDIIILHIKAKSF